MAQVLLESFEEQTTDPTGTEREFERGYAEGLSAGREAAMSEQGALARELVQNLADMEFKYNEVRGEITRSLAPLFGVLVDRVLPQILADVFAAQIVSLLLDLSQQNGASEFTLLLHPTRQTAVSAALAGAEVDVRITPDASLTGNAARISYDTGALQIDGDHLISDIRAILSSVDFIETRSEHHGQSDGTA